MARLNRRVIRSEAAAFWVRLAGKMAIALGVCLTAAILLAQAPAPVSVDSMAKEEEDDQGYKYQTPHESMTKGLKGKQDERQLRTNIRAALVSGTPPISDAAFKAKFEAYFLRYFFPLMTTPEGFRTITEDKRRFMDDLAAAKDKNWHDHLTNLSLAAATRIVRGNYRPPARYNAMLIISSLNDVEPAVVGTPKVLPEPMAAALPVIQQEFDRPENSSEIKLAALIGLSRHLEFDSFKTTGQPMPAATKNAIVDSLIKLAESKVPAADCTPEAHDWLRRRAVEALANACLLKSDQKVVDCLDKLLRDDADNVQLRCAVAAAVGKMNLQPPANLNPVESAKELGHLALVICDTELNRATKLRKEDDEHMARLAGTYQGELGPATAGGLRGSGGGYGPGEGGSGGIRPLRPIMPSAGPGGEAGMPIDPSTLDPKQYRYDYARRRMRQQLYFVQLGLTGGQDFAPKTTGPAPGGGSAGGSGPGGGADKGGSTTGGQPEDKRGVLAIAKNPADRDTIIDIYGKVRKLIVDIESRPSDTTSIDKLDTAVRRDMKPLEAVSRKLAAAPVAAAASDEPPGAPSQPKNKTGPKGPPSKVAPKGPAGFKSTGPRMPAGAIPTGAKGR